MVRLPGLLNRFLLPLQFYDESPSRASRQIESEDPHRFGVGQTVMASPQIESEPHKFDVRQTVPASPQIESEPHKFDASKSGCFTTAYSLYRGWKRRA